jgi:hypothetical protein
MRTYCHVYVPSYSSYSRRVLSDGQLDEVFVKQSRVLLCIMLTYADIC